MYITPELEIIPVRAALPQFSTNSVNDINASSVMVFDFDNPPYVYDLNPDVFTTPARFTPGNAARTVIQGPGLVNLDLAMMKNFLIRERFKLQFRWEAFNATNTPKFSVLGDVLV